MSPASTRAVKLAPARTASNAATTARRLVSTLGGRYSRELGIRLEVGHAAVDEWFCAATLFGTRISSEIAMRTYRELAAAGVHTVVDAGDREWSELVALLDAGGYTRYDYRTATRLQDLAVEVRERLAGSVATLATIAEPRALEAELDRLPGWGPTTVRIFLRELRGIWPAARPALDERTKQAARHLGFDLPRARSAQIDALQTTASRAGLDVRDLESALVRLALTHRDRRACPGGDACRALRPR